MKDWQIRAIKTFVQTFFGIIIPEFVAILNSGWPESWPLFWAALSPVIASALAGAICAVWNIILERLKN